MGSYNLVALVHSTEVISQVESAFDREGYRLQQVEGEVEAIELLQKGDWNGILIEVQSPHERFAVFSRLRKSWQGPIIALVARDVSGDIVSAYEAGIDSHVVVPFDPRELIARVAAVLLRAGASRTAARIMKAGEGSA